MRACLRTGPGPLQAGRKSSASLLDTVAAAAYTELENRDTTGGQIRAGTHCCQQVASCGVRTHAQLPAVDLKSTPLTTRANLLRVHLGHTYYQGTHWTHTAGTSQRLLHNVPPYRLLLKTDFLKFAGATGRCAKDVVLSPSELCVLRRCTVHARCHDTHSDTNRREPILTRTATRPYDNP